MAVYQSYNIARSRPRPVHGEASEAQHLHAIASLTTALQVGDVIQLGYLPPQAVLTGGGILRADQLDTGGAPTLAFNVGDGGFTGTAADPQRYFSAAAVGRAATGSDTNSVSGTNGRSRLFKNTSGANLLVYATVTAAAQAFQAGNLELLLTYLVEEAPSALFA